MSSSNNNIGSVGNAGSAGVDRNAAAAVPEVVSDSFAALRTLLADAAANSSAPRELYRSLYGIIARLCADYSERLGSDFSNLFSRLYAVCRTAHTDHHAIDAVRRRARLFMFGREEAPFALDRLRTDVSIVAHFAAILYKVGVPASLDALLPSSPISETAISGTPKSETSKGETSSSYSTKVSKLRAIVTAVNAAAGEFSCTTSRGDFVVSVPHLQRTLAVLTVGASVNLLDLEVTAPSNLPPTGEAYCAATPSPVGGRVGEGASARARMVILEPDYLLDVSALTASIKPYGTQAANYLLDCLTPRRTTIPIMVGNAANDFMDDLVNTPRNTGVSPVEETAKESEEMGFTGETPVLLELYNRSLRRHFKNYLLAYACLDEPLTANYFTTLRQTFDNIAEAVYHRFASDEVRLQPNGILLEPSFICEAIGLRGRFDVMAADHHTLLELKSGRADEFGHSRPQPQLAHVLQMSLYKEMLHYNFSLPRDTIRSFLLYSRYPAFFDERPSAQAVADVLELRNEIVAMEQQLREGRCDEVLEQLAPDRLNTNQVGGRFWQQYLLPQILEVYQPLKDATPLERSYFTHFLTFLEREKYVGKTTDNRPDSNRGLASAWTTDLATKQSTGDILIDLCLMKKEGTDGIETLTFALPDYGADFTPNFTCGEMVQLYERRTDRDTVTSRQLVRGYIEKLTQEELTLHLTYKQRNDCLFPTDTRYAIEHDGTDSLSTQAMRGLFSLLTATPRRRALLLAQREPEIRGGGLQAADALRGGELQSSDVLRGGGLQAAEVLDDTALDEALLTHTPAATVRIVHAARHAADYFLLVGPPGTGKTSVALRAMVEDFLRRNSPTPTLPRGEGAKKSAAALLTTNNSTTKNSEVGLLLMAYTNRAVDEICAMLETFKSLPLGGGLEGASLYVRLGNPQTCAPAFRPHLATELLSDCPNRRSICERLQQIPIVVGTVATLSGHTEIFRLRPFEAIIDEASQVLEPQILGLLCAKCPDGHSAIRKFTLIGDHKQLPAVVALPASQTVVSDPQLRAIGLTDLRNSLFQRLHLLLSREDVKSCSREEGAAARFSSSQLHNFTTPSPLVAMLDHQGRMHTDIARFVNAEFYGGQLLPVPLPHQTAPLDLCPTDDPLERFVASTRMGFVDVAEGSCEEVKLCSCEERADANFTSSQLHNSNSSQLHNFTTSQLHNSTTSNKANAAEAEVVARLVQTLCRLYERSGEPIDVARQVGVIVPFRSQIGMVRNALRRVGIAETALPTIDTVECYQGSQRDFILFSTTIREPYQVRLLSEAQTVDGTPVDRKLNVALTRARRQFFLVGNAVLLRRSPIYRRLIEDFTSRLELREELLP